MKLYLVPLFALLLACRPAGAIGPHSVPVPIRHLGPATGLPIVFSGLALATRTVVADQAAFDSLWRQAFTNPGGETPPPPNVDFTRFKVVFVALGEKPSGGHAISVTGAVRVADELVIEVESVKPGNCPTMAVMTQPMDVVEIPRPAANVLVRFAERTRISPCP